MDLPLPSIPSFPPPSYPSTTTTTTTTTTPPSPPLLPLNLQSTNALYKPNYSPAVQAYLQHRGRSLLPVPKQKYSAPSAFKIPKMILPLPEPILNKASKPRDFFGERSSTGRFVKETVTPEFAQSKYECACGVTYMRARKHHQDRHDVSHAHVSWLKAQPVTRLEI